MPQSDVSVTGKGWKKIISGRETAEHILEKELSKKVDELKAKNIIPNLVVILVGEMKASASYVAQKEKFAAKAGIKSEVRRFTAEISEEEILSEIDKINQDSLIHGVIVQLPLVRSKLVRDIGRDTPTGQLGRLH